MEYEYFLWLVDFIDPDGIVEKGYRDKMLYLLFNMEFVWSSEFPEDADRANDGLYLREIFANERGIYLPKKMYVNVLEVLVALARRIETEIISLPGNTNIPRWFWMFIDNLGISKGVSDEFDGYEIRRRVRGWMERRPGFSSILPVTWMNFDWRSVSIWRLASSYIVQNREKFGF